MSLLATEPGEISGCRPAQLNEDIGFARIVNGGGNMYRRGGAKMYHGLGGSLSP